MKYAIIIPDGAADSPLEELGGKTPLEAANKPNMDQVASIGRLGTVCTTPPDYSAGSDVCTLCLLGYAPAEYHPGRAPLEAAAMGLKLDLSDWVFRCNFVTIVDGKMVDHSAGHIKDSEARQLLEALSKALAPDSSISPVRFYPGVSYRNLMTYRGADFSKVKTTPPHDIPGEEIKNHLPRGQGSEPLLQMMQRARVVLEKQDVNAVRGQFNENLATDIWLWGQGRPKKIPGFQERFGLNGAMITAVDLLRGIANLIGWKNIDVPGITSYHDTDYKAQGRYTIDALDQYDIVCCHVEAPDEASHQADFATKIASIEAIDRHIVGPVLEKLKTFDEWRLLIMPDHATQCSTRKHHDAPVPFVIAGTDREGVVTRPFTEEAALQSDLHVKVGNELMDYFVSIASK
ncbi:MAG TPA: cofactor-independent phosphoglycerate mutase [Phycisphaerae bacterium]|nr:cofactor-independent phosphoglycerate mutase [Phycisphaerae bacterium]